jgi:hypothetical protein
VLKQVSYQAHPRLHLTPVLEVFRQRVKTDVVYFSGTSKGTLKQLYPNGIDKTHFAQGGKVEDCMLLAILFALSRNRQGADILGDMISCKPNGDYIVKFKPFPQFPITVTAREAQSNPVPQGERRPPHVLGDPGIRILELAYAKLRKRTGFPQDSEYTPVSDLPRFYSSMNYVGWPKPIINHLTGWDSQTITIRARQGSERLEDALSEFADNPQGSIIIAGSRKSPGAYKNPITKLIAAFEKTGDTDTLAKLEGMIASIFTESDLQDSPWYIDLGGKIVPRHAVAVDAVYPAEEIEDMEIRLRDPHDTRIALTLTFEDFLEHFSIVSVARTPSP